VTCRQQPTPAAPLLPSSSSSSASSSSIPQRLLRQTDEGQSNNDSTTLSRQTEWDSAAVAALRTSDGIVLPCKRVWSHVRVSRVFNLQVGAETSLNCVDDAPAVADGRRVGVDTAGTGVAVRPPLLWLPPPSDSQSDAVATTDLCEPDVAPLMAAWFDAPRDPHTGYRVRPPSLVKMAVRNRFVVHYKNREPWYESAAKETMVLRVFNAAVTAAGWVFTDNMLLRSQFHSHLDLYDVSAKLRSKPVTARVHVRRLLVIHYEWSHSGTHFSTETLPRLVAAADLASRHEDIVIAHSGGPAVAWLLPVRCIQFKSSPCACTQL
jgi:hypothetical protein